jgi:hypothetical protein
MGGSKAKVNMVFLAIGKLELGSRFHETKIAHFTNQNNHKEPM